MLRLFASPIRFALVILVLLGAALGGIFLLRSSGAWRTYQDTGKLWTLRYPSTWHTQPFGTDPGDFRGVLVSNVPFRFSHPHPNRVGYFTGAWDMSGLPETAVVVQVQLSDFGPISPHGPPWTHFPLHLADAKAVTDHPAFGAPQPRLFLPLNIAHQPHNYAVFAWFGRHASQADRHVAAQIVASLRFQTPRITLSPDQAPVGSAVSVRGSGFLGDWRDLALHGGFGITLLGKAADGCDASIGAQFEAISRTSLHIDGGGNLTGTFTVPSAGHCTAATAGSNQTPAVRPGLYSVLLGCYECDFDRFSVSAGSG